jgi:uncharacterized protein YkwD
MWGFIITNFTPNSPHTASKQSQTPGRVKRFFFLIPLALLLGACMGQNNPTAAPTSGAAITEAPAGQPAPTQVIQASPSATPVPTQAIAGSSTPASAATSQQSPTETAQPPTATATILATTQASTPASPTPTAAASPTATTPPPAATTPPPTTEAPSPTPANPQGSTSGGCTNLASFAADLTIPDDTLIDQGTQFVKTWRIYNAGTCTWTSQYALVFTDGNAMGAPTSTALPETAPGGTVDLSLTMTAPQQGGPAYGDWLLQNAQGDRFGVGLPASGAIWVRINVKYLGQNADLPSLPVTTTQTINKSGCAFQRNPGYESQILGLINQQRQNYGLKPLTPNVALSNAALFYSTDMACNNRVDFSRHTDSSGNRWYQRINAQGYSYSVALENVYVGNPTYGGPDGTPQGAISWWMNSPIHKANILNPDVTQIGIGYVYVANSDYGGYYTTDFASP